MTNNQIINSKHEYDLEERTFTFAKDCRDFVRSLPRRTANFEYSSQLIRSSGSQAANYIEANESVSKKDFAHRIKICRKEAKESKLWLKLCEVNGSAQLENERQRLIAESRELTRIFSTILKKFEV